MKYSVSVSKTTQFYGQNIEVEASCEEEAEDIAREQAESITSGWEPCEELYDAEDVEEVPN